MTALAPTNPLANRSVARAGREIVGTDEALEQLRRHCFELNQLAWCRGQWAIGMTPDGKRCIVRNDSPQR
jgi:hypothetical protein